DDEPSDQEPTCRTVPARIGVFERIAVGVGIQVAPTRQPNRIGLNVPPQCGVIIAHAVLREAAFTLHPLAGEPQILYYRNTCTNPFIPDQGSATLEPWPASLASSFPASLTTSPSAATGA